MSLEIASVIGGQEKTFFCIEAPGLLKYLHVMYMLFNAFFMSPLYFLSNTPN